MEYPTFVYFKFYANSLQIDSDFDLSAMERKNLFARQALLLTLNSYVEPLKDGTKFELEIKRKN